MCARAFPFLCYSVMQPDRGGLMQLIWWCDAFPKKFDAINRWKAFFFSAYSGAHYIVIENRFRCCLHCALTFNYVKFKPVYATRNKSIIIFLPRHYYTYFSHIFWMQILDLAQEIDKLQLVNYEKLFWCQKKNTYIHRPKIFGGSGADDAIKCHITLNILFLPF